LFIDARNDGAGIGVEAVDCVVIADRLHHSANQILKVDVGLGSDLAGDDDEAGAGQGFTGHAAVHIFPQASVENSV
jgi:hypothetical protein